MTLTERIASLSALTDSDGPVVSVYLSTRWTDEQQRERTRVFLKTELQRARDAHPAEGLAKALDWIGAEGAGLIAQTAHIDGSGVALFACPARELREVISVPTPVDNTFVVAARPFLRPLADSADQAPPTVVVFVDAESARLIPVLDATVGEEIHLESDVPGHHRRGGWAQLALGHYQRHIAERRGRHVEGVSAVLTRMVAEHDVQRIVIAGSSESTAALRRALPSAVAARVAGVLSASRNEPASQLVARAAGVIGRIATRETEAALDAVLTEAAKGGAAAGSLEGVLEALQRGAVDRLYMLRAFRERGRSCPGCAGLQPGDMATCRLCHCTTTAVELGEAMVSRAIATGGAVTMVDAHAGLTAVGGVAARLRFDL